HPPRGGHGMPARRAVVSRHRAGAERAAVRAAGLGAARAGRGPGGATCADGRRSRAVWRSCVVTGEELTALAARIAESPAFQAKRDIAAVAAQIEAAPAAVARWQPGPERIWIGDDTAAIPDGGGYLLLAAEGILPEFLARDPWFAGFSAVMVNVSDVAAMGGYPLAVVDVYFQSAAARADLVLGGVRAACEA